MILRVLSLFAGVGCFDLAAERVGMHVTAHCEIDPAARKVLRKHFPAARSYDDVRTLTGDRLRADGALPDLILAGFPCQDLSVAGRRAGLGGGRSGLFFEITRLLAETGARWFVLENVPGLLSSVCPCPGDGACERRDEAENPYGAVPVSCGGEPHGVTGGACIGGCVASHGGALGAVLGTVGELGYGFAYRVLDAQHFGVPQRRRRVFIVGRLGDRAAPAQVLLEPEGCDRDLAPSLTARPGAATGVAAGVGSSRVASCLTAREGKGPDSDLTSGTLVETVSTLQGGGFADIGWTRSQPLAGISSRRGLVSALTASGVGTCGPDDNQAQAGHLIAHTLTAEGADASEDGTGRGQGELGGVGLHGELSGGTDDIAQSVTTSNGQPGGVIIGVAVRRLTPTECERLQGLPDDWTLTGIDDNGNLIKNADSARYRFCGNGGAVPVMEWILARLSAADEAAA